MNINEIKQKKYLQDSVFILNLLKSFSFFVISILISHFAVIYANKHTGPTLNDLFLNNIKFIDTSYIHIWVAFYLYYLVFIFLIFNIEYLPFSLNSISLLVLTRSFFINLTNLGPPENSPHIATFLTQRGDLFFSGHVAIPFLLALIFWDEKIPRYFFLFISLFMLVSVLIGHQHYSIDVFSAPFIAYGIYEISKIVFKGNYDIIKS